MEQYDEYLQKLKSIQSFDEPDYIQQEPNPHIKLLHKIYFAEKVLSAVPTLSDDRDINKQRMTQIRNIEKPYIDTRKIIDDIRQLSIKQLIELYKTYGYGEFLVLLREKYNIRSQLGLEKKERSMIKRYWKNARPTENLVYDTAVIKATPNPNSGITPEYIRLTRSIKPENEKEILRTVDREGYPDIIMPYNKALEKKILDNIVKCHSIPIKQPMDITESLITSLNFYKYAMSDDITQLINTVMLDIRKFMIDALYGVNPNIKNKRELFYGNANIIFDILKNIRSSIRVTSFSLGLIIPATTRENRMELTGKIKFMIIKAIDGSGIKMQKRGIEQVLCI